MLTTEDGIDQIVRLGEAIYQREIRPKVEDQHRGEFLALDVESGDYAIGADELTAVRNLRVRRPGVVPYIVRIGHPTAAVIGGHLQEPQP
ncbi:MAG: hypothetical protein HY320_12800 [Armatimonadetes bacterium]|nr:hypothetical protein [Armatimonadota bacterium]